MQSIFTGTLTSDGTIQWAIQKNPPAAAEWLIISRKDPTPSPAQTHRAKHVEVQHPHLSVGVGDGLSFLPYLDEDLVHDLNQPTVRLGAL